MSSPEVPKGEKPSGIPRITSEDLEGFDPGRDFTPQFEALKMEQPELARWLITGNSLGSSPEDLRARRAFIAGVMGTYALISTALAVERFKQEMDETNPIDPPNDGDDAGEDLRPSA